MREETLNYFRSLLVLKRSELLSAAFRTISDMKADTGKQADPLDRAVVEFDRQMELSIRGRERKILQDIQQALLRIDGGIFGVCDICGMPISEKRLRARPTTLLCVDCQQQQETVSRNVNRWVSGNWRTSCYEA